MSNDDATTTSPRHVSELLGVRIDALEEKLSSKIGTLGEKMDSILSDHHETRDELRTKLAKQDERASKQEDKIRSMEMELARRHGDPAQIVDLEKKVAELNALLADHKVKMGMIWSGVGAGWLAFIGLLIKLVVGSGAK